jgi:hypothetical protein
MAYTFTVLSEAFLLVAILKPPKNARFELEELGLF